MTPVLEDRWTRLATLSLKKGSHSPDSEMCVMEAVAFVAGEEWSDSPTCSCPVIAAFLRNWNDSLRSDAERDRLLKPLIPRLVDTKGSEALEERRSLMAADWLVRVSTPAWLRLAGVTVHADALASLPEITNMAQVPSLRGPLAAARQDADAAWAAARDAAWDAAWAAARDAARDAAGAKLKPVVDELQQSALQLVERMIAAKDSTVPESV